MRSESGGKAIKQKKTEPTKPSGKHRLRKLCWEQGRQGVQKRTGMMPEEKMEWGWDWLRMPQAGLYFIRILSKADQEVFSLQIYFEGTTTESADGMVLGRERSQH